MSQSASKSVRSEVPRSAAQKSLVFKDVVVTALSLAILPRLPELVVCASRDIVELAILLKVAEESKMLLNVVDESEMLLKVVDELKAEILLF